MSQTTAKRPLTTLQKNTKKSVTVRLKNDVEYKGKIDNVDSYMNLIMTDAEELKDGKSVVTSVSTATLESGSCLRNSSSIASELWSDTLSG